MIGGEVSLALEVHYPTLNLEFGHQAASQMMSFLAPDHELDRKSTRTDEHLSQ